MPRYDLAGNPLPEVGASPPATAPPGQGATHPALPARQDFQGRPLHLAPPPPAGSPAPVRYDLAGNPLPAAPVPAAPASGPTAYGMPPSGPAPVASGVWPPPPAGAAYGRPQFQNNSGQQAQLPPEIARLRWNWGAFFFPILWCKKHGMTTVAASLGGALLVLRWARRITFFINPAAYGVLWVIYGVCYFALSMYFGFTGHSYGWRNRRFEGIEDYLSCQRKWMWWGFGINGFLTVILPVLLLAGLIGSASITGGTSTSSPSSSDVSPYNNPAGTSTSGDGSPGATGSGQ